MKDSKNGTGFEAGHDEFPSWEDPTTNVNGHDDSLMETSEFKNTEAGGNYRSSTTEEQRSKNTTGDNGIRMRDSSENEFYSLGKEAVADDQYMRILHSQEPALRKTKKMKISLKPKVHAASSPKALNVSGTFKTGGASGGGDEHQCSCCFKKFPTIKSLCGHMRFHPERKWKGIRLSDPHNTSSSTSESRGTPDQEEDKDFLDLSADQEEDQRKEVTPTMETMDNDSCDLTRFLPKWTRTGWRGENSLVLIDLPAQPDNTPMTLRLDRTILTSDHIPMSALRKQDLSDKQKAALIKIEAVEDEKIMESQQQAESKSCSRILIDRKGCSWPGHASITADASNSFSTRVIPSKKATECKYRVEANGDQKIIMEMSMEMKMKWKSTPRAFEPQIQKKIFKKPYDHQYTCKTCNKTFTTFQALGGHRSGHHKDQNTQAVEPSLALKQKKDATPIVKVEERREFGEHASLHICNLCYKSFPTGQALGGHKKHHWAAAISTISSSSSKP